MSASVDGLRVAVGKADLMATLGLDPTPARVAAGAELALGATVVYVAVDGALAGCVTLRDETRPDAGEAVARLKAEGLQTALLTGGGPGCGH